MKLQTFEQFVYNKATQAEVIQEQRLMYKNIFGQFNEIKPILNEAHAMVDAGIFDDMLIEHLMVMDESEINENLFQKAKDKFNSAIATAKEKGKSALSDAQKVLIKLGGDISNVIKLIVKEIAAAAKKAFDTAKSVATKAASKSKGAIVKAVNGAKDKSLLATEIKNAKGMLGGLQKWVLSGFHKEAAKGMVDAAKTEESYYTIELGIYKAINEAINSGDLDFSDMINEGGGAEIPFVSSIAAKLNKIPPFSLLYKIKNAVKKVVGGALDKLSVWATEAAGAPGPYKFVALATIIGVIAEMEVKGVGKKLLKHSLHAIPGAGTVIVIAADVAKYLAYIAIIETLLAEVQGGDKEEAKA